MKVAVIGGGPSGVISAIELAKNGIEVYIIEKKERILKKLLATGNGRCNYTNIDIAPKHYNEKEKFVEPALSEFTRDNLIDYFKLMGIEPTIENDGKIFPITLKANTVVNTLLEELESLGVEIYTNTELIEIFRDKNEFILKTGNGKFNAEYIVFATGGSSMPVSGSDGKSYKILEKLGHKKTKIYPALTQIKLNLKYLKQISGVKVVGKVRLIKNGELIDYKYGDLLFTNYGISGPPILDLSRKVNKSGGELFIEMPLINNIKNEEEFKKILYNRFYTLSHFTLERWLMGIIEKKLVNMVVKETGYERTTPMYLMDEYDFEKIIKIILKSKFEIIGTKGFENSQVTCGGISVKEIDSKTMESKKIKNLYIIGEVMDVDGDCGGYNLQWAFSSGIMAARAILKQN